MKAIISLCFSILLFHAIDRIDGYKKRAIIPANHISQLLTTVEAYAHDPVLVWNQVMLQACANDYDKSLILKKDQDGPAATARAFAIIHGSMFDAMQEYYKAFDEISGQQASGCNQAQRRTGMIAAIIEAAYRALTEMYPQQSTLFIAVYQWHLAQIVSRSPTRIEINMGLVAGRITADQLIKNRRSDGSDIEESYTPVNMPGYHQLDPTRTNQGFTSPHWGKVRPFFIDSSSKHRANNDIGDTVSTRALYLNSSQYDIELKEVKALGAKTSIHRTSDQTEIGIAWAYDGAPRIGTPPRLYNQIVRVIATGQGQSIEDHARLFALVNYAMADTAIAAWETKYHYNFWRPIIAIRRSTNPRHADSTWTPLGSPADGDGPNFTPGFPAYISGHAAFGSATFQILRDFYGRDDISFTFQSDEYNGKTRDSNTGLPRPSKTRHFGSLTAADQENADSRIYLGVHWRQDAIQGQHLGQDVAKEVFIKFHSS